MLNRIFIFSTAKIPISYLIYLFHQLRQELRISTLGELTDRNAAIKRICEAAAFQFSQNTV